jgi:hypothetical protein
VRTGGSFAEDGGEPNGNLAALLLMIGSDRLRRCA